MLINMKNKVVVLHGELKIRVEVRREGKEMFKHMAVCLLSEKKRLELVGEI